MAGAVFVEPLTAEPHSPRPLYTRLDTPPSLNRRHQAEGMHAGDKFHYDAGIFGLQGYETRREDMCCKGFRACDAHQPFKLCILTSDAAFYGQGFRLEPLGLIANALARYRQ
jgi:hypothetical protein